MSLRGLIASVGGSPEPVRKALEGRPDHVLFIVSDGSRPEVENKILPGLDYVPQYRYSEVSDHQDVGTCYKKIRADIERWLREGKLAPEEIYVDITGGTKAMSGALLLAAVERFKNFTYVGGFKRDANDLGTVISGSEHVIECQNPWNAYAVRELERANALLKEFYADSATAILEHAADQCDESQRARLEAFAGLARALAGADCFDFKRAWFEFNRCRQKLELCFEYPLYQMLVTLHDHWQAVRSQIERPSKTAGRETLLELLANAERRAKQFRFDDAVGRLYRAVELRGQQLVREAFGAELGKVPIECFPAECHKEVIEMLGQPNKSSYNLGVRNLFQVLAFRENESLSEQAQIYDRLENHLQKRNNSLLAHGLQPVKAVAFNSFWETTLSAFDICESDIPRWPQLAFKLP